MTSHAEIEANGGQVAARTECGSSRAMREILLAAPVMPVINLHRVEDAVPLAEALGAGGITAIEVTLRTPAGLPAIAAIAKAVPDVVVGAGTVLDLNDLTRARTAGARFAVSPGYAPEVVATAVAGEFPFMPGIATPSEAMAVMAAGHDVAKLFPAGALGGLAMARALGGPFPGLSLCPTGGVGPDTVAPYLAEPNVLAVGGTWLAGEAEIAAGAWSRIADRAAEAMAAAGYRDQPAATG